MQTNTNTLIYMQFHKAFNFLLFISFLIFLSCGENPSNGTEKIKISVKIDGSGNYDEVRLQNARKIRSAMGGVRSYKQ